MRRKVLIVAVSAAFLAASLTLGLRSVLRGDEQLPSPAPSATPPVSAADQYMGVGSCASPACHGGPATLANDKQKGKWDSSYTVWVERDKHAQAYRVLYDERSKIIASNLHLSKEPYKEPRCVACHSTIGDNSRNRCAIVGDGVGCESCHGPARGWLTEHYAITFKPDDPATYRDPHGPPADDLRGPRMVNTRNAAVRAEVCVDCHVGAPARNGSPTRNMDHDMIAAGHPRLTFEFRAYLANMPHHWDDQSRNSAMDDPAQVWAVGQIALTESALRLLAARAAASANAGPWPEFAEYDCYSCHHGLSQENYRQKRLAAGAGGQRGQYVWATWHLPLTRLLLAECESAPGKPAAASLERVRTLLRDPLPTPGAVAAAADSASYRLQELLNGSNKLLFDRQHVERVLNAIKDQPAANWDEACGQCLLFQAACSGDRRFDAPLLEIRELLRFDKPHGNDPAEYNSPVDFDPLRFNHKMGDIRRLLPRQLPP